jgi:hypothetical protein
MSISEQEHHLEPRERNEVNDGGGGGSAWWCVCVYVCVCGGVQSDMHLGEGSRLA